MFESVVPDPGADALKRAARIFFVIAALSVIGSALFLLVAAMGGAFRPLQLVIYLGFGALAYFTGRGIEDQRPWAKWAGITLGILELLNFPIGTIIGVAILVYLNRAIKAHLFVATPPRSAA
jgi:predicted membrane channel-forming protein YqfA (hemolysin III family)